MKSTEICRCRMDRAEIADGKSVTGREREREDAGVEVVFWKIRSAFLLHPCFHDQSVCQLAFGILNFGFWFFAVPDYGKIDAKVSKAIEINLKFEIKMR